GQQVLPRTLALVPLEAGIDLPLHASSLVDALAGFGRVDLVGRERAGHHSPQWFHERETQNDFVVYAAEAADSPWTRLCLRQADVVLLLARATGDDAGWAGGQWQDGAI